MWKFNKLSLILAVFCISEIQAVPVNISVYYESLCQDSIRFITKQFYPTYESFEKYVTVDLVPFGKASANYDNGTWEFTCQHGPEECYGNKFHSCAVSLNSTQESTKFIYCSMSSRDPASTQVLKQCSENSGISWDALETCYQSGQGDSLLAQNGNRTKAVKPAITFVPTILFNDYYNQTLQSWSLSDFKGLLCNLLDDEPDECNYYAAYEQIEVVRL